MPQTAFHGNDILVAADLTEAREWEKVRKWSGTGQLKMTCCPTQGTAVQNESGFRFFRHQGKSTDCGGGKESIEHEKLKVAAYKVAKSCGYDAELEATISPDWRADVLITDPQTGEKSAIEIQRSDQKNYETRERVRRHHASRIRSIWFFLRRKDFEEIPPDLAAAGLPAFCFRASDIDGRIGELRGLLTALLRGTLIYDRGEGLDRVPVSIVGYDYPCEGCLRNWFRTTYAIAFPNRIRGNFMPIIKPVGPGWESVLAKFCKALEKTGGKIGGANDHNALVCPYCGTAPVQEFLTADEVLLCPDREIAATLDYRKEADIKPGWRTVPAPAQEQRMSPENWREILQRGLNAVAADRNRRAREREEQERVAAEQERLRRTQAQRNLQQRELFAVQAILRCCLDSYQIEAWLISQNNYMKGRTPMSLINSHVEKHWDDNLPPRSEPARLLSGIEEGKIEPSESVGLTLGGLIKIRKAFLQRARKARLDSAQGVAAKGVAFLALHAGNVIDELRFSAAAKRT